VLEVCSAARPTTAVYSAGRSATGVMTVATTQTKTQSFVLNAIQPVTTQTGSLSIH